MKIETIVTKLGEAIEKERLVTLDEAAEIRGCTRPAISQLVQKGRLRSVDILGRVLVYRDEVEGFVREKPGRRPATS